MSNFASKCRNVPKTDDQWECMMEKLGMLDPQLSPQIAKNTAYFDAMANDSAGSADSALILEPDELPQESGTAAQPWATQPNLQAQHVDALVRTSPRNSSQSQRRSLVQPTNKSGLTTAHPVTSMHACDEEPEPAREPDPRSPKDPLGSGRGDNFVSTGTDANLHTLVSVLACFLLPKAADSDSRSESALTLRR